MIGFVCSAIHHCVCIESQLTTHARLSVLQVGETVERKKRLSHRPCAPLFGVLCARETHGGGLRNGISSPGFIEFKEWFDLAARSAAVGRTTAPLSETCGYLRSNCAPIGTGAPLLCGREV